MGEITQLKIAMTQAPIQNPLQQEEQDTDVLVEQPAKVILFNDEVHSFDEVIGQIIKATGCETSKAEALTWEVHTSGKAMVFEGQMDNCLKVSHILEEIALNTQIEI
jgi:ATP-dependent Clp protease adaptor protein ClpS